MYILWWCYRAAVIQVQLIMPIMSDTVYDSDPTQTEDPIFNQANRTFFTSETFQSSKPQGTPYQRNLHTFLRSRMPVHGSLLHLNQHD